MKKLSERVTVEYFEGSSYWEVKVDGDVVHTATEKEDADLFRARLLVECNWDIAK